jgi:GDP-L-fucose synthase
MSAAMSLSGKRVLVTGGHGFVGSHLMDVLRTTSGIALCAPRRSECDLRDRAAVQQLFSQVRPQVVFHLAANVGGIGANQENPGSFMFDNLQMGLTVIDEARLHNVDSLVLAGTICAYPKYTPVPFREEDLWNGYPEETNAPYGIAKKALGVLAQAYRQQYGMRSTFLLPVNMYGPRDDFDLRSSHVIPALIRKCLTAVNRGDEVVTLWGDGSPTREFLYVSDFVEALILAAEHGDDADPINVGTGREVTIASIAQMIAERTGFVGRLEWDRNKPNGQPRRCLDVSRAKERLGFEASVSLEDGLDRTIDWYLRNQQAIEPADVNMKTEAA